MNGTVSIPVSNPFGHFENEKTGSSARQVATRGWPYNAIYEVTINAGTPVIYHSRGGKLIRVGWRFLSDRGSIPVLFQCLPGLAADAYLIAYYFHDFICGAGGCYVSEDKGLTWDFVKMTRLQADDLLYAMIGALGGGWTVRHTVWVGIRTGAKWQKHPGGFWALNADGSLSEETDFTIPSMKGL